MAAVAAPMYSNNHHHSFLPQLNRASYSAPQHHHAFPDDEQFTTIFCRALYDYEGKDASALSFNRGDIIEVLTQELSGWWDGLLGDDRGWFPSNYVEVISDEEAEQAFFASESSGPETSASMTLADTSTVDMTHAMTRGISQEANEEWLESEMSYSMSGAGGVPNSVQTSSDYWVPDVGAGGRVFYVNTQTGQHAFDIPDALNDDMSDTELAGLASQASSRSGTSAGLAFGLNGSLDSVDGMQDYAGFGIPRRTGTPEPWVRKLHDDGKSWYFFNKVDGRIEWTRPEAAPRTSSQSSSSSPARSGVVNGNNAKRHSVYSDDSDIQPFEPLSRRPTTNGHPANPPPEYQPQPFTRTIPPPDYTTAERIAQSLQKAVAPPNPEHITELAAVTKSAIQAVINNVQLNGVARRPEEDRKMNEMIHNVVHVVRNLLYALAVQNLQIPPNVLPWDADLPSTSQSPLKPAQRKVTATLSRLVLSARAIQYDSGLLIADTLGRIEVDAEGLEKDVTAFIQQVQQLETSAEVPRRKHPKRLQGVFSPANIGPGLVGAGAGGRWKGFGWVPVEEDPASSRSVLGIEVISDLKESSNLLDIQFQYVLRALQTSDRNSIEQVRLTGRDLVARVSSILALVNDIHVARHVDIDGPQQDGSSSNGTYSQTVEAARQLVRTLETVVQAVHNDISIFLVTMQSVRDSDLPQYRQERNYAWDHLDALSSSMSANVSVLVDTLDALLSLGHTQAEIAAGDYNGSIEWRMSRLSVVRPVSSYMYDDDEDDKDGPIDMEMAFVRPPAKNVKNPDPYPLYNRPHADSDTSHTLANSSIAYGSSVGDTLVPDVELIRDREGSPAFDEDPGANKSPPRSTGSKKLEQLLGDEYLNKVAADLKPWYLRPTYTPEEILIDADNTVKGGTLPALVERLTAHDSVDPSFNQAFLMTFKSFTTVNDLFDLLVARFRTEPPLDLKSIELEEWEKQKKLPIQLRVINMFVIMLKDDDVLEKEDLHILDRMRGFVTSNEVSHIGAAKQVLVYIDRALRNDSNAPKAMPLSQPPAPILPKTSKKLKLADIEPLELARQLTIMESNLYQKIKPMECLQRAREQKTENMDNIAIVIQTSNRIADWVAESVLSKEDSRKRAAAVKHLISVADRCRTLNNFSSMIAITSGLNTPPIRRLKRTWDQVNNRSMAQFGACEMTIDSNKNFTKYRQLMASVTPPCVPFIGVFLSTLQFIQDGNPDMLPGGLVNFRKRQKASEVINDIKRWQAQPFNFILLPTVQTYIEETLNQFNDTKASSEHFWALSLEREPREREDEKMARLLQESGFL
ncbi:hypothetical protein C0991_000405 [Blastosporella zonata]|nr:hypothetical protein C0991_000405 [Blastosporella zonata]